MVGVHHIAAEIISLHSHINNKAPTTVSCRLDCAIKNGTASCGYKSQPLSARQTKKSPWQYSLEVFQGILSRIFLAVP